jgi:hypothetical protein
MNILWRLPASPRGEREKGEASETFSAGNPSIGCFVLLFKFYTALVLLTLGGFTFRASL